MTSSTQRLRASVCMHACMSMYNRYIYVIYIYLYMFIYVYVYMYIYIYSGKSTDGSALEIDGSTDYNCVMHTCIYK